MRSFLLLNCLLLLFAWGSVAQDACGSYSYEQSELQKSPELREKIALIHKNRFLSETRSNVAGGGTGTGSPSIIRIPVVVHVLYNTPEQNISDEQVRSQIAVLNKAFRLLHPDTVKIPAIFRPLAADCRIEFTLASISPDGYISNGIVRKKTNSKTFGSDDKIKFTSSGGDDAWDSDRYLNIWTGNLTFSLIGYSSVLGGAREKDGIVIRFDAFGETGTLKAPYLQGKTAIHEAGHWMGLKHIWGDRWCGDDGVDDTPAQPGATRGCPGTFVKACNDLASGAMFNNYMDLSHDDCLLLFTTGQMELMRSSFLAGAPHHALLFSNGSTAIGLPRPDPVPDTVELNLARLYPNPAQSVLMIDISKSQKSLGATAIIYNQLGQVLIQQKITRSQTSIQISQLKNGTYFVRISGNKTPLRFTKIEGLSE